MFLKYTYLYHITKFSCFLFLFSINLDFIVFLFLSFQISQARAFAIQKQIKHRVSEMALHDTISQGVCQYVQTMIDLITETVYRVVSRALFGKHQILFSFFLCTRIQMHKTNAKMQLIGEADWHCFLHGSSTSVFANGGNKSPSKGMYRF